eukprot:gnl/MRDRNA2_/MRDRNA2_327901_c0_seq1.p2 gnl/MRDRNA2_/MRDRNA2_327901_c0~~gnl/MRDRNA2_/MRDRNA2_327901_c0_seq1.p2  ORF type:complete len:100 (+),score=22.58 gnl/MRDRNA2_/MRDRNA2_327901_c0_seq1:169-468(+)
MKCSRAFGQALLQMHCRAFKMKGPGLTRNNENMHAECLGSQNGKTEHAEWDADRRKWANVVHVKDLGDAFLKAIRSSNEGQACECIEKGAPVNAPNKDG